MAIPNNGIANGLSIQRETAFAAASVEPVYSVPGKVNFTHSPVLAGSSRKVTVWREDSTNTFTSKSWQCSLEMELGFNEVTRLLLSSLLEQVSATDDSGFTTYLYRPVRLGGISSLKLALDYNPDGPFFVYRGVVIDSVSVIIRLRQTCRLRIEFKAVDVTQGSANGLGSPIVLAPNLASHLTAAFTMDTVLNPSLTEITLNFQHPKRPTRFGEDKLATRFVFDGQFALGGELAEYFNGDSVIPALMRNNTEAAFAFQVADPTEGNRILSVSWPRIIFTEGTPPGVQASDTSYRGSFAGLLSQSIDFENESQISLALNTP